MPNGRPLPWIDATAVLRARGRSTDSAVGALAGKLGGTQMPLPNFQASAFPRRSCSLMLATWSYHAGRAGAQSLGVCGAQCGIGSLAIRFLWSGDVSCSEIAG